MIKRGKTNQVLTDYLKLFEFKSVARTAIMKKCGWSKCTFHKKIKTPQSMSELEREYVDNIFSTTLEQSKISREKILQS